VHSGKEIQKAIYKYLYDNWNGETAIEYPGMEFDPRKLNIKEWIQLVNIATDTLIQRRKDNRKSISVLIHIYHTFNTNFYRCQELGDILIKLFDKKDVEIPFFGILRFTEAHYQYHGHEVTKREGFETASIRINGFYEGC